jgi:3-oxoacyl-[acyl-carrier-protein] synthase III
MGIIIRSVAFTRPLAAKSTVRLSAKAARLCLKKAGLGFGDVGMMINTGVYSESHLREPAVSSLIQKQLQFPVRFKRYFPTGPGKVFSFDLHNGGGGGLNAIQVLDGFIRSGKTMNGLVVSGDTTPVFGRSENYNYAPGAAALLLSDRKGSGGFKHFRTESFSEYLPDFESTIIWGPNEFLFSVRQKENYVRNCVQCAEKAIHRMLEEVNLSPEQIDLIIPSQSPAGFAVGIKGRPALGKTLVLKGEYEYYSSGLFYALSKVFYNGGFRSARNILFVSVGAGITTTCSLYINE